MKQTSISSPHYSLCSIKEELNDQRKIFLSWWLSFSLLLRCVWNDLTLGAWCWHRLASVMKGGRSVTWACNTKFSELSPGSLKSPDPWPRRPGGEKGSNSNKAVTSEKWGERRQTLSRARGPRVDRNLSVTNVSNLHSRVHWVLFEMPSSIRCIFLALSSCIIPAKCPDTVNMPWKSEGNRLIINVEKV